MQFNGIIVIFLSILIIAVGFILFRSFLGFRSREEKKGYVQNIGLFSLQVILFLICLIVYFSRVQYNGIISWALTGVIVFLNLGFLFKSRSTARNR
jgi:hypothetical protein